MKVKINGNIEEIKEGETIEGLLASRSINKSGIAVELNREIVPRAKHGEIKLKEGDSLEIVRMTGGG